MLAPPLQRLVTELAQAAGDRQPHRAAARVPRPARLRRGRARARRRDPRRQGEDHALRGLLQPRRGPALHDLPRRAPRRRALICVVEEPGDVIPIERTHEFRGRYHVLGGALSPIDGVEPEDLRLAQLYARVARRARVREVVLATNPTTTGEATALHIAGGAARARAGRRRHAPGLRPARSAATSSTPTRSRSAARSPAAARSRRAGGRGRSPCAADARASARARPRPGQRAGTAPGRRGCAAARRARPPVGARRRAERADDSPRARPRAGARGAQRSSARSARRRFERRAGGRAPGPTGPSARRAERARAAAARGRRGASRTRRRAAGGRRRRRSR